MTTDRGCRDRANPYGRGRGRQEKKFVKKGSI